MASRVWFHEGGSGLGQELKGSFCKVLILDVFIFLYYYSLFFFYFVFSSYICCLL